jgi:hypothetical protein
MKKFILPLVLALVGLASCTTYGKKVKISDHLEIYMKGDNVTETEAKKLGTYIDTLWKDATNDKSFQLSKDSSGYVVRMVVDEKKYKEDSSLSASFMALQTLFETQVFPGSKVKLVLTDNTFKDIKGAVFTGSTDSKEPSDSSKTQDSTIKK